MDLSNRDYGDAVLHRVIFYPLALLSGSSTTATLFILLRALETTANASTSLTQFPVFMIMCAILGGLACWRAHPESVQLSVWERAIGWILLIASCAPVGAFFVIFQERDATAVSL
ncbi:MAG: hypothetical protein AAGJ87_02865 [Pseudomonadota bacterium]